MNAGLALSILLAVGGQEPGEAAAPAAPVEPVAPGTPVEVSDLKSLARELRKSVVLLSVETPTGPGTGTGFVVREDGWIATNHHVIATATSITATFDGGLKMEATGVLARDEEHDLALIKVAASGLVPLLLGSSEGIEQGTRVVLLGNPTGLSLSLSDGIVAAVRDGGIGKAGESEPAWRQRLIQITAPISPGSSGSPAVTLDKKVLGVAMGERLGGQNLNFIIPVERLASLMENVGDEEALEPVAQLPWINIAVSGAFFVLLVVGFVVMRRPPKPKPPAKKKKSGGGRAPDWVQ